MTYQQRQAIPVAPGSILRIGTILGMCASLTACDGSESFVMELVEVSSVRLPDEVRPRGTAVSASGDIGILSAQPSTIVVLGSSGSRIIELHDKQDPIAIRFDESRTATLEVFDAGSRIIASYGPGEMVRERPVSTPAVPLYAAPAPHGWFVVCTDAQEMELYWLRDGRWKYLIGMPAAEMGSYHLGGAGDRAILTRTIPPNEIVVVDTSGAVVFHHGSVNSVSDPSALRIQRAFPAVPVGGMIIQTLVDRQDDVFRLVLYGASGTMVRWTTVPHPTTIVAALADSTQLLALRNIAGYPEVVIYTWRWRDSKDRTIVTRWEEK